MIIIPQVNVCYLYPHFTPAEKAEAQTSIQCFLETESELKEQSQGV